MFIAQKPAVPIFGNVNPPDYLTKYTNVVGPNFGLIVLFNNILRLVFLIGGIYVFVNMIMAGYQYMNAGGDPKQIEAAWSKIWQSIMGLTIMVVSFILAAIIGFLLFGDPAFIFKPKLYGP